MVRCLCFFVVCNLYFVFCILYFSVRACQSSLNLSNVAYVTLMLYSGNFPL